MNEIYTEDFHSLSQIAITIAGFAALFSLLESPADTKSLKYKVNAIRFFMMVELACMIAIFCFLPIILASYYPGQEIFRTTSWIYIPANLGYLTFCIFRNRKLTGKVFIDGVSTKIVIFFSLAFAALAAYNAMGFYGKNYQQTYTLILFLTFLFNLYFFWRLIHFSIHIEDHVKEDTTVSTPESPHAK